MNHFLEACVSWRTIEGLALKSTLVLVRREWPLLRRLHGDPKVVESEAATLLAFRVAETFGNSVSEHDKRLGRLLTPVSKYWVCKRAPNLAYEAMECHGGNGEIWCGATVWPLALLSHQTLPSFYALNKQVTSRMAQCPAFLDNPHSMPSGRDLGTSSASIFSA